MDTNQTLIYLYGYSGADIVNRSFRYVGSEKKIDEYNKLCKQYEKEGDIERGRYPWTESDIARAEKKYKLADAYRLASLIVEGLVKR